MAASSGLSGPREMRDAFAEALVELGAERPEMIVLDADLSTSSKTIAFKQRYPDRFLQLGIAEQDLMGVAAGLAQEGYLPFPSTFAAFAARRALDQIALSICYPNLNVKIPGSYVGLPTSRAGASHNCIEDIAVFRSLPNMKVADPGDNAELRAIIRAAADTPGPAYFRITRLTLDDIFEEGHVFEWGQGHVVRSGSDVTLVGTGMMTSLCLRAVELLAQDRIDAEVVHMGSIKPIDAGLLEESARRTGCVVTAENATIIGGLGAAVTETLAERHPVPVERIGVRDRWVDSGGIQELFTHHGMQPSDIAAAARSAMATRDKKEGN
jgi:transketolase